MSLTSSSPYSCSPFQPHSTRPTPAPGKGLHIQPRMPQNCSSRHACTHSTPPLLHPRSLSEASDATCGRISAPFTHRVLRCLLSEITRNRLNVLFFYTCYCSCLSCCDAERTKPVLCTMAACNAPLFGQHVLLLRQCVLVRCGVASSISCSARSSTSARADCVTTCAASSACSVFAVYVVDQLSQWSLLVLRHQLELVHEVNELPHTAQRSTASSSVR